MELFGAWGAFEPIERFCREEILEFWLQLAAVGSDNGGLVVEGLWYGCWGTEAWFPVVGDSTTVSSSCEEVDASDFGVDDGGEGALGVRDKAHEGADANEGNT